MTTAQTKLKKKKKKQHRLSTWDHNNIIDNLDMEKLLFQLRLFASKNITKK